MQLWLSLDRMSAAGVQVEAQRQQANAQAQMRAAQQRAHAMLYHPLPGEMPQARAAAPGAPGVLPPEAANRAAPPARVAMVRINVRVALQTVVIALLLWQVGLQSTWLVWLYRVSVRLRERGGMGREGERGGSEWGRMVERVNWRAWRRGGPNV